MTVETPFLALNWPQPDGVQACITTRHGGSSLPPYASNNLALHVGDEAAAVMANRQRLCESLELVKPPQWLEQVHGVKVAMAKADGQARTADACFTTEPGLACVVMTADCLPILVCDQKGTQVAAIHAGWRSLAKGIIGRTLQKFTGPTTQLLAYLGPAISQSHFEVGVEVLEAFFKMARDGQHSDEIAHSFRPGQRPLHFYADIYALARAELKALGVHHVYGGDYCTFADSDRFYSYRRDKVTGRMASLIWLSER